MAAPDTVVECPHGPGGDIHVWMIRLDAEQSFFDNAWNTLSDEERRRADRFHFNRDRRRFVISHACLRRILSRYLRLKPHCLQFSTGRHGKPLLVSRGNNTDIRFNLSHAEEMALVAVSDSTEVGIDVEYALRDCEIEAVASSFFSPQERKILKEQPDPAKHRRAFFRIWTRKEAWIKCTGKGFHQPVSELDLSSADGRTNYLTAPAGDTDTAWTIRDIPLAATDYIASLAHEGAEKDVLSFQWRHAPEAGNLYV